MGLRAPVELCCIFPGDSSILALPLSSFSLSGDNRRSYHFLTSDRVPDSAVFFVSAYLYFS